MYTKGDTPSWPYAQATHQPNVKPVLQHRNTLPPSNITAFVVTLSAFRTTFKLHPILPNFPFCKLEIADRP